MSSDRSSNKSVKIDFSKLNYEEKLIAECISIYKNISIDQLAKKINKDINQISPILTMLELDDVIEQLPGNKFCVKN